MRWWRCRPTRPGAAYLEGSTVLRLGDGRLRYLPSGASEPVTGPPDDPAALAVAAEERAWLAAGTVPGANAAERDAAARSLLFLRLLIRPGGAALAAQTPYWAYVWPRDASFTAAALAVTGHRREAAAILRFLAGTQRPDGTWPARSHPDGRPVDDGRPAQLDATGWVSWAAWLASDQGRDTDLAARLWPTVRAAADHAAAALGPDGLPGGARLLGTPRARPHPRHRGRPPRRPPRRHPARRPPRGRDAGGTTAVRQGEGPPPSEAGRRARRGPRRRAVRDAAGRRDAWGGRGTAGAGVAREFGAGGFSGTRVGVGRTRR